MMAKRQRPSQNSRNPLPTALKTPLNLRTLSMKNLTALLALWLFAATSVCEALDTYQNSSVQPPQIPREFRGAWISEVASNADWPSQPGLSVAEQKAGLIALLDHAVQLHLNTVVFQVRPACDAVYYSPYEPWSEGPHRHARPGAGPLLRSAGVRHPGSPQTRSRIARLV